MTTLKDKIDMTRIPQHIAIIMDGNGRWAKQHGKERLFGHYNGVESVRVVVETSVNLGVKYLTLYTFSTENWKRAQEEVGYLMGLIKGHLRAEFEFYKQNKIKVEHIGDLNGLPQDVQQEIINVKKDTENFSDLTVVLAINYGGKDEIIRGINKILKDSNNINSIDEKDLYKNFDIPNLPDVDFLIRTGGEKRLSNFLLWHSAYAELCFTNTLWPDYTEEEFKNNINEFYNRTRRFGDVLR